MKDLNLYKDDKLSLCNGKWISDTIICAAQKLLQIAYPYVRGLQDPILGETLAFKIQKEEFVQIVNVSQNHWITISTINCKPGIVSVYDSLPSCDVPKRTKEQIAALLFSTKKNITLNFKAVQTQHGSSDCGLFAIAFATSLCAGNKPEETTDIQHLLRGHLFDCLSTKVISLFPTTSRKKKSSALRAQTKFEIYCLCRLPADGQMIQCESCGEWFHDHCVAVPQSVWNCPQSQWYCSLCI